MAEFPYNNTKNANTGQTFFELNCQYYPRVSFEDNTNSRTKSHLAEELAIELRDLIFIC